MYINSRLIATFDIETDPFKNGREPRPFCCGIYTDKWYYEFWGEDCIEQFLNFLDNCETRLLIYAHNGGKFDYAYLAELGALEGQLMIIHNRIARMTYGEHELRDSYCILPFPLAAYEKDTIDYNTFEADKREKHKKNILTYLYKDCIYLYQLVTAFIDRFGPKLTIGGTAIEKLRELHPFENTDESYDSMIRPYYFGGRVQTFKSGVIKGNFTVYDVNSMYPSVMSKRWHPTGADVTRTLGHKRINPRLDNFGTLDSDPDQPYFVRLYAYNYGAFCARNKQGGLSFDETEGEFYVTSHELQKALEMNLCEVVEYRELIVHHEKIIFSEFVDTYMQDKINAKNIDDWKGERFAKLILNSAYGKTAQNPDSYYDYIACDPYHPPDFDEWEWYGEIGSDVDIYRRPTLRGTYYNVAIAASITGAARSVLLDALPRAKGLVYCDTDSIICEKVSGIDLHPSRLGAWDVEGTGDEIAIAGKKLYALFDNNMPTGKMASKGVRLEPADIKAIANGEIVEWTNEAPSINIVANTKNFISRNVRNTAKKSKIGK